MRAATLAMFACLALAGCARRPPPATEVEGTVYLDNQPLPNARVEFIPELEGFGAELYSHAVTDDRGRYKLAFTYTEQPGAVVATHRVVVSDPPPPREARGVDGQSQEKLTQFLGALKNRPIPENYGSAVKTPLLVEVSAEKKTYDLHLSRAN